MNQNIRKFLIKQCISGKPIHYEEIGNKLKLDLSNISDRNKLSNILGEISAFEYEKGRPLISSIAIYKQTNDHGLGFYNLCQDLKIGKVKDLQESYYGFTQLEACKTFWQNSDNYDNFFELSTPIYDETNSPPFFNLQEIEFFKLWCNKTYNPSNSDHKNAKNYLLETVWAKTRFWSNEVVARLKGYETSNKRMWSKRDWDDGRPVSSFKPYTWARIYKNGDNLKDIFFTIGVDPEDNALVYKLDYFREAGSKLTEEQKKLCAKYIPKDLSWNEISIDDLVNLNWESIISLAVDFISKNSQHYDQVVKLTWGEVNPIKVFENSLTCRSFPKGGLQVLPKLNPSFKGSNVDFKEKSIENKELGDAGEELVKDFEIQRLNEKGMSVSANKVRIAKDGEGFDVLSFDDNGNEKYIEVKTTEGHEKMPFYLSLNEYLFCEQNKGKYSIYRLYNYNYDTNHAEYFIIDSPLDMLLFQPTEFKVYLKATKE